DTSTEIIKDIAEELEQSPNGVRMILVQAGVYVKKDAGGESKDTKATKTEPGKRTSKESQISALRSAIQAAGKEVDEDILEKMTGKAAAYFTKLLT
ncbi:MAG TPA: hypothetical protein V6C58_25265, partial [Allocoleopsis sp.]